MKRVFYKIVLVGLIFSLAGCVTILGTKRQKVKITAATKDARIYVDGGGMRNDTIKTKLEKKRPHTISAVKEGYKTRYGVLSPEKASYLYYGDVAVLPVFYGLFTVVSLLVDASSSSIKGRRFKSKFEMAPLILLPRKEVDEKYIWVEDVMVSIQKGDVLGKFYTSTRKMKRDKAYEEYKADENALYDVPVFKNDMNEILLSYGYSDTSENIITSSWNSLYLTSEIKTLNTNIASLKGIKTRLPNTQMNIELNVEWILYDGFGNNIFQTTTVGVSDTRWGPLKISESKFQRSMKDAIEYAILDLYSIPEFKEVIKLDSDLAMGRKNAETEIEVVFSENDHGRCELEDQLNSIVRLTSNEFNYSGTVISTEGHIVTSYQAISSGKELIVVLNGEQLKAEVISTNAHMNLALIKVESDSLHPIKWNVAKKSNLGEQVFTLSFSRLEILDKYISSGIISGFRSFQSKPYIQSDVPMSFGNSGGTMLNSKGQILGILNAKANIEGVEGIGFAIPIEDVLTGLGIVVKYE